MRKELLWEKGFLWKRRRNHKEAAFQGSMTVEACLAIPLFLFFLMSILYLFQIIHLQTQVLSALHQEGNQILLQAYRYRDQCKQDRIVLEEKYRIKPFLFWMDAWDLEWEHPYYGHAWVGYDVSRSAEEGDSVTYVYVAETGRVYHRRKDCTYLDLSVRSVERREVSSLRNKGGGHYYECEICKEEGGTLCYLTDYGTRYHSSPVCAGLKRTVYKMPLTEAVAQGKSICSKCKKEEQNRKEGG